jgi:hypothetical protein
MLGVFCVYLSIPLGDADTNIKQRKLLSRAVAGLGVMCMIPGFLTLSVVAVFG